MLHGKIIFSNANEDGASFDDLWTLRWLSYSAFICMFNVY